MTGDRAEAKPPQPASRSAIAKFQLLEGPELGMPMALSSG